MLVTIFFKAWFLTYFRYLHKRLFHILSTLAEILKISDSLGMLSEIDSLENLEEYFNHRHSELIKEEEKLWEKYFHENLVAKEYEIRDEDTMTLSEEIEANYADWNYYLADIIKIHEFLSTKVNTIDE